MVCRMSWSQTQSGLSLPEQLLDLFRCNLLEPLCVCARARVHVCVCVPVPSLCHPPQDLPLPCFFFFKAPPPSWGLN